MKSIKKSGFTLVEVVIIATIIGLLAAVCIPYSFKAYSLSLNKIKHRNITEIEKAKGILTLPVSAGIPGAAGLYDRELLIDEQPELLEKICASLSINNLDELEIDGENVRIGSLSSKAVYSRSGATAD